MQPERAFLVIQVRYQGRVVYDGVLAIDLPCELRKHVHICLPVRLLELTIDERATCAPNKFEQALRIDVRVPYIEMAHVPELPHALTIRLQAIQCCLPVTGSREAVLPPGDHDAGDQSLHIPLP